jgi:tetratricopeptide (TPR) repeat protein
VPGDRGKGDGVQHERAVDERIEADARNREARYHGRGEDALADVDREHGRRERFALRSECVRAARVAAAELADVDAPEEIAELAMNQGLCLQSLAALKKAPITDAIKAYQEALRTFDKAQFPKEYAILQNNLATAFLAIPFSDERAKMREALAVQSFEEGLSAVDLIAHPTEYAMLQNNLGNALQYATSAHPIANNLRALEAYEEALKVRNPRDTPLEYANTIANKANCLANLPDDPGHPERGNEGTLKAAALLYGEARAIFEQHGERQKAEIVAAAILELAPIAPGTAGDGAAVHPDGRET